MLLLLVCVGSGAVWVLLLWVGCEHLGVMEMGFSGPTGIDHVGVIVRSLERAKAFLGGDLGLPLVKEAAIAGRGTKAAFFRCGDCEIEVIEVLVEESRRVRLGDNEARIEHIAVRVPSLASVLAHLGGLGAEMDAAPLLHDGDLMSFSVPATTMGLRFQFIEKDVAGS